MPPAAGCARCDEPATIVVVEVSAVTAYLDLCEEHLADLLRGARAADVMGSPGPQRFAAQKFGETRARS